MVWWKCWHADLWKVCCCDTRVTWCTGGGSEEKVTRIRWMNAKGCVIISNRSGSTSGGCSDFVLAQLTYFSFVDQLSRQLKAKHSRNHRHFTDKKQNFLGGGKECACTLNSDESKQRIQTSPKRTMLYQKNGANVYWKLKDVETKIDWSHFLFTTKSNSTTDLCRIHLQVWTVLQTDRIYWFFHLLKV